MRKRLRAQKQIRCEPLDLWLRLPLPRPPATHTPPLTLTPLCRVYVCEREREEEQLKIESNRNKTKRNPLNAACKQNGHVTRRQTPPCPTPTTPSASPLLTPPPPLPALLSATYVLLALDKLPRKIIPTGGSCIRILEAPS